ncbi:MAG: zinc ABC transporter substrate-binding protein [Saprospiraceae bacterium]|nr:zinc ABC transporter substrate-binding protein [Saprospiraceae bacterium]
MLPRSLLSVTFVAACAVLWAQERPLVVSTASIFADMAKNIAGDQLEVRSIVPIGGDPHIYEPTPGDARLAAEADLVIRNGLTFEGWLDELIENSGTKARIVTITQGIQPIESQQYLNSSDPHAWMDAAHGLVYVKNIVDALVELDPGNADIYRFNYELYRDQIAEMDAYILDRIREVPEERRVLITSHDAFRYYGLRYGIQVEAVLGTSTDAEAQTSDIMRLNRVIREKKVPAVFIESTVNPKLLKQLAADNDVVIGGQLYSDSIGDENSPAPTYLDMLKYNTDVIVKALTAERESGSGQEDEGQSPWTLYALIGILLLGGFALLFQKLNP